MHANTSRDRIDQATIRADRVEKGGGVEELLLVCPSALLLVFVEPKPSWGASSVTFGVPDLGQVSAIGVCGKEAEFKGLGRCYFDKFF